MGERSYPDVPRVYIDMDGVLADFDRAANEVGYRAAVEWIALNDNVADAEPEEVIRAYLTVALVTDLFGVTVDRVAADVVQHRTKSGRLERIEHEA